MNDAHDDCEDDAGNVLLVATGEHHPSVVIARAAALRCAALVR